jgi:hypothetical protein
MGCGGSRQEQLGTIKSHNSNKAEQENIGKEDKKDEINDGEVNPPLILSANTSSNPALYRLLQHICHDHKDYIERAHHVRIEKVFL